MVENPDYVYYSERTRLLNRRLERLARDERHGVVDEIFMLPCREQRHDMRMLEAGSHLDLAAEPGPVHICRQLRGQQLDDDLPAE